MDVEARLEGLFLPTGTNPGPPASSFTALQRRMPSVYADLTKEVAGRLWNIYQSQYGTQHYQLLPERDPEKTLMVHSEVGAMRMWLSENGRHPELNEWRAKIPSFDNHVMSRQGELPKLYVPYEDNEVNTQFLTLIFTQIFWVFLIS